VRVLVHVLRQLDVGEAIDLDRAARALGDREADPTKLLWATGMTLRDWFAGQALARIQAEFRDDYSDLGARCYAQADAMLVERAKP
jgi:hypothetical protein